MNKKVKKVFIILVIISIIFIGYGLFFEKDKKVNSKLNVTLLDYDAMKVSIEKNYIPFFSEYFPLEDTKFINNNKMLQFAFWQSENLHINDTNTYPSFSQLKEYVNNIFDYDLKANNIKDDSGNIILQYNKNTDKFVPLDTNIIKYPTTITIPIFSITSKKVVNDKVFITTKILYGDICEDNCKLSNNLYISYKDSKNKKHIGVINNTTEALLKKYDKNIPKTIFIFKKSKNNFILKKVLVKNNN